MFKCKSLDKKGFSHVEIIIFIVVILAVGGIGYYALRGSGASNVPTIGKQASTNNEAVARQAADAAEKAAEAEINTSQVDVDNDVNQVQGDASAASQIGDSSNVAN